MVAFWWVLVLVLYLLSGVTSLWLAKKTGAKLSFEEGHFWWVFYLGPLSLLYYGPLYIAQLLGHEFDS